VAVAFRLCRARRQGRTAQAVGPGLTARAKEDSLSEAYGCAARLSNWRDGPFSLWWTSLRTSLRVGGDWRGASFAGRGERPPGSGWFAVGDGDDGGEDIVHAGVGAGAVEVTEGVLKVL